MLEGREKYMVYREMYAAIAELERYITEQIEKKGHKVISVFLSVGDEETRRYFVDLEYSDDKPGTYRRVRGLFNREAIVKMR